MKDREIKLLLSVLCVTIWLGAGGVPCRAEQQSNGKESVSHFATVATIKERDAIPAPADGCTVLLQATGNVHRWKAAAKKWEVLNGSNIVNVKDYGAVGDGQTDDAPAIQAAIDAAHKNPSCASAPYEGCYYYGIGPEILLPSGTYRVSRPLCLAHYTRLRGEGNAALKADKPDQDILVPAEGAATWRNQISGLCFLGGGRALVLNTHNLDSGNIIISRCQFNGSNICAIFVVDGSNSTLLKITDCEFLRCQQALRNGCDMAVLSDSWITSRETMKNKAVMENRGVLILERLLGVPSVAPANNQRWIDNYGSVTCRTCRFGGEGAGFCAVNNLAPYQRKWPVIPTSVTLEDCMIYGLGNPKRKAAIYCEEVPNMITVRNCTGLPDLPVLQLDPKINPDAYFADALANPSLCRCLLSDNTVNEMVAVNSLPPVMRKFASRPTGVVNAREFVAAGNGANERHHAFADGHGLCGGGALAAGHSPGRLSDHQDNQRDRRRGARRGKTSYFRRRQEF